MLNRKTVTGQENDLNELKILSYNICGLQNKTIFPDFFKFVKSHDVFILLETFAVMENTSKYEKYFGGFKLHWIGATRQSIFGRAMGGMVLGCKCEIFGRKVIFEEINGIMTIVVNANNNLIRVLPVYLGGNVWERDFGILSEYLWENGRNNMLMMGDFNVRVGELQQIDE